MVKKRYPNRGEMVIGTVVKVNPFSAMVRLDEYDNIEGMIHVSEVARRWVKDIKKVVKPGQKIVAAVMRVDADRGHINLSLKRINKYDAEEKLKQFKREQKADKMLRVVAKRLDMDLDKAREDIGSKMRKDFEEVFKAFQEAAAEGSEILIKKGFDKKQAEIITEIAKDQLEAKEQKMTRIIEIKCFKSNGVEIIKKALKNAEKNNDVEIRYVSAPEYSLTLKTKNAKKGDAILTAAVDEIKKLIESDGGECSVKGD